MFDEKLREWVVNTLGLQDAAEEDRDVALAHVEEIANKRLVRAIPEMLDDNQLNQVESMRAAGESEDKIVAWIKEQLTDYDGMLEAVIRDVAEEISKS